MPEPSAWRHLTPHGWVVTKTDTDGKSEPLYTLQAARERFDLDRVEANLIVARAWIEKGEPGKARTAIWAAMEVLRRTSESAPHTGREGES